MNSLKIFLNGEELTQPISTTLASYEEHTGEPETEVTFESFYELEKPSIIHEDWKVEPKGTYEKAVEAIRRLKKALKAIAEEDKIPFKDE